MIEEESQDDEDEEDLDDDDDEEEEMEEQEDFKVNKKPLSLCSPPEPPGITIRTGYLLQKIPRHELGLLYCAVSKLTQTFLRFSVLNLILHTVFFF